NAAYYGVPQMRERMFLLAYSSDVAAEVRFPEPTHWVDLPPGYEGSRSVALKLLAGHDAHSYVEPPEARRNLPPAVTAELAIGDLPPINARKLLKSGQLRRGARRFDEKVSYEAESHSTYTRLMRNWEGFEAPAHLTDHVIRYLPRDYDLFARMNAGDQYPEAYRPALAMLEAHLT